MLSKYAAAGSLEIAVVRQQGVKFAPPIVHMSRCHRRKRRPQAAARPSNGVCDAVVDMGRSSSLLAVDPKARLDRGHSHRAVLRTMAARRVCGHNTCPFRGSETSFLGDGVTPDPSRPTCIRRVVMLSLEDLGSNYAAVHRPGNCDTDTWRPSHSTHRNSTGCGSESPHLRNVLRQLGNPL